MLDQAHEVEDYATSVTDQHLMKERGWTTSSHTTPAAGEGKAKARLVC